MSFQKINEDRPYSNNNITLGYAIHSTDLNPAIWPNHYLINLSKRLIYKGPNDSSLIKDLAPNISSTNKDIYFSNQSNPQQYLSAPPAFIKYPIGE